MKNALWCLLVSISFGPLPTLAALPSTNTYAAVDNYVTAMGTLPTQFKGKELQSKMKEVSDGFAQEIAGVPKEQLKEALTTSLVSHGYNSHQIQNIEVASQILGQANSENRELNKSEKKRVNTLLASLTPATGNLLSGCQIASIIAGSLVAAVAIHLYLKPGSDWTYGGFVVSILSLIFFGYAAADDC